MSSPTLAIVASIAAALAAGAWAVPSDHLRMQLQLRDHDLEAARASFERLGAQSSMSEATLHAAAQLYRDLGDADHSIVLLLQHLEKHPGDVYSRRLLVEQLREAGLLEAYLQQLELLSDTAGNPAMIAERANVLAVQGNMPAMVEALEALHALGAATPMQLIVLAEHYAAERPSHAAQLLLEVDATAPQTLTMAQRKLLFVLLEQQQRFSEAAALAQRWYASANVPEDEALVFSGWLLRNGQEALAAQILAAATASSLDPARLRSLLIDVRLRAGQRAEALTLLNQWHQQGGMPQGLVTVWAELVLETGDTTALHVLLPILRNQATGSPDTAYLEHLYVQALKQLGRHDELATLFESRLNSPMPERRSEALAALLDLHRQEPVVRHLRSPQGAQLPATQQRQLAYRLLELGDKQVAVEAFQRLASNAPPDADDVKALLYLWGPRPGPAAMDWLAARAERASSREQADWLAMLLERGGAQRIVAMLQSAANTLKPPQLRIHVLSLAALERWEELKPLLPAALESATDPQDIERIAYWAERLGLSDLGERAWRALLVHRPQDAQALLSLGLRSYARRQLDEAVRFLSAYFEAGNDNAEANYFLAEGLRELGRGSDATLHFERAVKAVPDDDTAPTRLRVLRALALNRLGHVDQSIAELDRLHRSAPGDRQILEDYVRVLLEHKRAAQARQILEKAGEGDRG